MKKNFFSNGGIKKTVIPLSVALAMLTSGTAFASPQLFDVDTGNGTIRINAKLLGSDAYRAYVQSLLTDALNAGRPVTIKDNANENHWIDYGANRASGLSYRDIVEGTGDPDRTDITIGAPIADKELTIDESGVVVETEVELDFTYLEKALAEAEALIADGNYGADELTRLQNLVAELRQLLTNGSLTKQSDIGDKTQTLYALIQVVVDTETEYPVS